MVSVMPVAAGPCGALQKNRSVVSVRSRASARLHQPRSTPDRVSSERKTNRRDARKGRRWPAVGASPLDRFTVSRRTESALLDGVIKGRRGAAVPGAGAPRRSRARTGSQPAPRSPAAMRSRSSASEGQMRGSSAVFAASAAVVWRITSSSSALPARARGCLPKLVTRRSTARAPSSATLTLTVVRPGAGDRDIVNPATATSAGTRSRTPRVPAARDRHHVVGGEHRITLRPWPAHFRSRRFRLLRRNRPAG